MTRWRAHGAMRWHASVWWAPVLAALALLVVAAPPVEAGTAQARPEPSWERLADGPDRALHGMVHDPVNDMLWSFGGVEADPGSNRFHNTVYRLNLAQDGAPWERLALGGLRPPPMAFHTAVYDPVRQRMIVYGGLVDRTASDQQPADGNTVWFLDLTDPQAPTWSRESVAGNATDRFAHAAVYVPGEDAMVVSGGLSTFSQARNDNYALLLGEEPMRWVRLANAGFNYRGAHLLLHDEANRRLLAYGGLTDFDDVDTLSDLVALDISAGLSDADQWRRVQTSTPGVRRAFMAGAFDASRRLWWVHGGIADNGRFLRELSVLDLTGDEPEWVRTSVVYNGPLERFGHASVWDSVRERAIFQGGTPDNNITLKDTRSLVFAAVEPTATVTPTVDASATPTPSPTATHTPTTAATHTPAVNMTPTAMPSPTPPDDQAAWVWLPIALHLRELR